MSRFIVRLSQPDDDNESVLLASPVQDKPSPWSCIGLFMAVWLVILVAVLYSMAG